MYTTKTPKAIRLSGTQKPFLERSDILTRYYHEIQGFNPLPHDRIMDLFHTFKHGSEEEKKQARDTIFNHNTLLVVSMARNYCSSSDNLMDLIEEGNIGLLNAIEKFNPTKNSSFQKYALYHIRKNINLFKTNYTPAVRQTNSSKTDTALSSIVADFMQKEERAPIPSEIVEAYNEKNPNKKICEEGDVINVEYVRIDNLVPVNGEISDTRGFLEYTNTTSSYNDALEHFSHEESTEMLNFLMKDLKPLEKQALNMFYGLNGEIETSLGVIGIKMKCSAERARQLCKSALDKMKRRTEKIAFAK